MAIVEHHTSPDGLLQLLVDHSDDCDWTVGFQGFAWHTHGDIFHWSGYEGTPEQRVREFVDDIVASRRVIVIATLDEKIRDIWVTDDPDKNEMKYAPPNETIEKRFWNGTAFVGQVRHSDE